LNLASLIGRVRSGEPCPAEELIIATNPTADGDATALYIQQTLQNLPVKLTRLALGMPNNSAVESADETTLGRALLGRQDLRAQ
jgi:recombination protein RecR